MPFRTRACSHLLRAALLGILCVTSLMIGCARKERVLDVEGPGVNVEVDRNLDTGAVEVEVDNPKKD